MTSASPWAIFSSLCLPWKQAVARGAVIKNILLYLSTLSVLGIGPLSCQSSLWIPSLWIHSIISLSCSLKHWSGLSAAHFSLRPSSPNNIDHHIICLCLVLVRCASQPICNAGLFTAVCCLASQAAACLYSLWLCSVVNWVYKVRYYYVINTFIVSVRFWPAVADKCWRFSGKFDCVP